MRLLTMKHLLLLCLLFFSFTVLLIIYEVDDIPDSQIRKRMAQIQKTKKLLTYVGRFDFMGDYLHEQTLQDLIELPSKFQPDHASQTTVYIHNPCAATLHKQLKAVFEQTIQPAAIVVYLYDVLNPVVGRDIQAVIDSSQKQYPDGTIQVVTTSESFSFHGRFQSLLGCRTKYAWVIDADVIPGKSLLHLFLHTSQTALYPHSILGTVGCVLPMPGNALASHSTSPFGGDADDPSSAGVSSSDADVLRYPDTGNGIFADKIMEVDYLIGMWFMEAEMVKYFLAEAPKLLGDLGSVEDLLVSTATKVHTGTGSYVLPTSSENSSMFGDISVWFGEASGNGGGGLSDAKAMKRREHLHWRMLQRGSKFVMSETLRGLRHMNAPTEEMKSDTGQLVSGGQTRAGGLASDDKDVAKISLRVLVYLDPFQPLSPSLFHTISYAAQQHSEKWYHAEKFLGIGTAARLSLKSSLSILLLTQQAENVQLTHRKGIMNRDLEHCFQMLTQMGVPTPMDLCTGRRSGMYVIPVPEDFLSVATRTRNLTSLVDSMGTMQRQKKGRRDMSTALLDEALERSFQMNVRRVLDTADADLIVVPRGRTRTGDSPSFHQLRGSGADQLPMETSAEGLLTMRDMLRHITDAADFMNVPIIHPTDHIRPIGGPEHAAGANTHPIHSLFSLSLPLLREVLTSSVPVEIVLHNGPLLVEQLMSVCKAIAAVPSFPAPILFRVVMAHELSERAQRSASEVSLLTMDTLTHMQQMGYILDFHVHVLEDAGSVLSSERGVDCPPLVEALRATNTASLPDAGYMLYLSPNITHLSHATLFYLRLVLAKTSLACAPAASLPKTHAADMWQSLRSFARSDVTNSSSWRARAATLVCNDSSRYVSLGLHGKNRMSPSTASHFITLTAPGGSSALFSTDLWRRLQESAELWSAPDGVLDRDADSSIGHNASGVDTQDASACSIISSSSGEVGAVTDKGSGYRELIFSCPIIDLADIYSTGHALLATTVRRALDSSVPTTGYGNKLRSHGHTTSMTPNLASFEHIRKALDK